MKSRFSIFTLLLIFIALVSCKSVPTANDRNIAAPTGATIKVTQDSAQQNQIPNGLGICFWSGQLAGMTDEWTLPKSIEFLATKGFGTVYFPFDPQNFQRFFFLKNLKYDENTFLTVAANSPPVASALANPNINKYMLTVYDAIVTGISGEQRRFNDEDFLRSRKEDIIRSYRDFALVLYRSYRNSGKTFIISNWETDNAVYCGEAYSFELNQIVRDSAGKTKYRFRDHCIEVMTRRYKESVPAKAFEKAFETLALWFEYRKAGIEEAKAVAVSEGIQGVSVKTGVAFNAVTMIHDLGFPTVLYDLLKKHGELFDVVSGSVYESTNQGLLPANVPLMKKLTEGHLLAFSEFGFKRDSKYKVNGQQISGTEMMRQTIPQIVTLLEKREIDFATIWQAFPKQVKKGEKFELFTSDGADTEMFQALLSGLRLVSEVKE